jgi:MSHA biogenesis protein MshJ
VNALQARWVQWSERFAALARRERLVLLAAFCVGGGVLGFNFGIEPMLIKARVASRAESTARAEVAKLQAEAAVLKGLDTDPDVARRQRLAKLRSEQTAVAARLAAFEAGMVPPAKMQGFLERLLARNGGVELLSLRTLPATPLGAAQALASPIALPQPEAKPEATPGADAAPRGAGIFQHGIELKLAGSYSDLMRYVEDVERSPQRVMWHSLTLNTEKYPRNVMVLRLFTLSLDRQWLTV